ncbi:STAS domain-containing protein [Kibdelosporangium philippinense]|uniref:Anti-sigma factor antagonist n=1 Tax=Kibdelosporangium philippinense TaxID=211113 RepID=A0ABS8ZHF3_9PSEU|nr:STAS domain-containing protein [Kibdelosporangium philippinense]MCE7007205.1 STAS domain-containing protein [Kibdelosporangium philippinense]
MSNFEAYLGFTGRTGTVFVSGELDVDTAPVFRSLVEQAVQRPLDRLVIDLTGLSIMSSAGVRALVFAQQELPPGASIIVVGAGPEVVKIIQLAGFDQAITIADRAA